jgi:hypothetical protein
VFCVAQHHCTALPAGEIPFRLPGFARLAAEPGLGRVTSVQNNFLSADYPTIYGLPEFRPFGDDLGVLPMFYFFSLSSRFWGHLADARDFDVGLRLLGAANVRWLLFYPGTALAHPALRTFYDGPDMTVAENRHALPRAAFFANWTSVPLGDWRDWSRRDALFADFSARLRAGLDPARTLALDEPPAAPPPPGAAGPAPVRIEEYSPARVRLAVDAPSPGFVFLSDNDFPGWRASVDGTPARTLRAWISFRAVQVPAGRSTVDFVYRPVRVWAALLLSALCSLAWAARWAAARARAAPAADGAFAAGGAAELLVAVLVGSSLLFWLVLAARALA